MEPVKGQQEQKHYEVSETVEIFTVATLNHPGMVELHLSKHMFVDILHTVYIRQFFMMGGDCYSSRSNFLGSRNIQLLHFFNLFPT